MLDLVQHGNGKRIARSCSSVLSRSRLISFLLVLLVCVPPTILLLIHVLFSTEKLGPVLQFLLEGRALSNGLGHRSLTLVELRRVLLVHAQPLQETIQSM